MTRARTHRFSRGFTLVEILIAVAIAALLFTATATAMKACVDSFTANQASADTLQRARVTMLRLSQQIRAGEDHLPVTTARQTSFIAGTTVTDSGITFIDDKGQTIRCSYNAGTQVLSIQVDGGTARTLASSVSTFTVRMVPVRSAGSIKTGGVYDELERVTITLAINPVVDGNEMLGQPVTLSESITPRARLWN